MRIRIALTTAVAVIVSTGAFFTFLGSSPAASAGSRPTHPHHITRHHILRNTQLAFFHIPATVKAVPGSGLNLGGKAPTPAQVAPQPAVVPAAEPQTDANSVYTADWQCIRVHESGNNYNNANMPSGAYGILASTWHAFGFSGWPYQAAPIVQDALALKLHSMYGFHPWSSRHACGL